MNLWNFLIATIISKTSFSIWLYPFSAGNKVLDACAIALTWLLLSLCDIKVPKPKLPASFATIIFLFGSLCVRLKYGVNILLFPQKLSDIRYPNFTSNLFSIIRLGELLICVYLG